MMAQRIHLHGGPWHDRIVVIPDNRDHLHILGTTIDFKGVSDNDSIETKEGTYSSIRGFPGNFEWDRWITHD